MFVAEFDTMGFLRQIKTVKKLQHNQKILTEEQVNQFKEQSLYDTKGTPQYIYDEIDLTKACSDTDKKRWKGKDFIYQNQLKGLLFPNYYTTLSPKESMI